MHDVENENFQVCLQMSKFVFKFRICKQARFRVNNAIRSIQRNKQVKRLNARVVSMCLDVSRACRIRETLEMNNYYREDQAVCIYWFQIPANSTQNFYSLHK